MVQVKVEHVIVVLLGLFLLYHFMGSCGCNRVEGWIDMGYNDTQPYVEGNSYCGLRDTYLTNVEQKVAAETTNLQSAIDSLNTKRGELADLNDEWLLAKSDYDDTVRQITAVTTANAARDLISALNKKGEDTNSLRGQIVSKLKEMDDQKTIIDNYTTNINNIAKKYKGYSSVCSEPNRILRRDKPEVACDPRSGGKVPQNTSFRSMPVQSDRDYFTNEDHIKSRTWTDDSGKDWNVCKVNTDNGGSQYAFAGYIGKDERDRSYGSDAWTTTKWNNYKTNSSLNIVPNPSPVAPFPSAPAPVYDVDGEYFDQDLINTFDPDVQDAVRQGITDYETNKAAQLAKLRAGTTSV
jgi:hypothetical protein